MKYILYSYLLIQLLSIKIKCEPQQATATAVPTARLLYLMIHDNKSIHTINERSTFTNKLNKGWIFDANTDIDVLFYILINKSSVKTIELLNQTSFVHFTTHENDCSVKKSNTFQINYTKNLNSRLPSGGSSGSGGNETHHSNEAYLLIGEVRVNLEHSASKYYTCLSVDNSASFTHQGTDNQWNSIITTKALLPIYLVIIFYFVLLSLSALFSGLNLGLMSLDLNELKLLMRCGTKREQYYAKKIQPLRKRGNFLLCTILLGNVLVNSTSTLILGSYLDGLFAAIGSTLFIVIFGEIIPQAACSRYGLAVGTYTRFVTYFFMALTSPLSFTLGWILDHTLGKEIASTYTRDKVRELMKEANLEENQKKFISGALDFKNKRVEDVMVPVKEVFKIDINACLDFETFCDIADHGYSRIPLFEHSEENLIGIILMQDLLVNDPADKLPLRSVHDYFKHKVAKCTVNDTLDRMFEKFRQGESHMAFVYPSDDDKNENREAVGIVTLEDVIEELVQSEILDESDCKRENKKKRAREAVKGKLKNPLLETADNWNIFVRQEDTSKPLISPQIRKALYQFLSTTVKPFTIDFINPKVLESALKRPDLIKEKINIADTEDMYLFKFGEPSDYFIIILDGNASMEIGKDKIVVQGGLFSYYGVNALINDPSSHHSIQDILANEHQYKTYAPEFSLKVTQRCVYLQLTREEWLKYVKTSSLERKYSVIASSNSA